MSLSIIFSPDSPKLFACFLKTVMRLSYDIHTSVTNFPLCKFALILRRQACDILTNIVRLSHNGRATYFCEKIRIKF